MIPPFTPIISISDRNVNTLSLQILLFRLPDLRQPLECGTDEMMLFGSTDLDGHLARDFSSAYHKHPAPGQLLPGNFVYGLALLRAVGGQITVRRTEIKNAVCQL